MSYILSSVQQKMDFKIINQRFPTIKKILYTLLTIDLLFLLLHFYTWTLPGIEGNIKNMRLDMDFGYAEIFQYLKFIAVAAILLYLFIKERLVVYLVWSLFHVLLFADDAFQFHEGLGGKFARYFEIPPAFGLRTQDFGELAIAAFLGLICVVPILYTIFMSNTKAKLISIHYLLLIGLLIFFGVGIDIIHSFLNFLPASGILSVVEDAGEMFAASFIVWYTLYLFFKRKGPSRAGNSKF